jgi:heat shock protein HtpX
MIRSAVLLAAMAGLFVGFGGLFGIEAAAVALWLAIVASAWSFFRAGPAIIARCGARRIGDARLVEMVNELAKRAAIPAPWLFEVQDKQPNAFAIGRDPAHAAIVITTALARRLNEDELRAVLGHEISHIVNRDTLSATIGATLLSAIAALALLLGVVGLAARRNGGGALIVLAILAPVAGLVLHLAMSRSQEYRADHEGARLCGAEHLISALIKLDGATRAIPSAAAKAQPAIAGLFIVDPLPNTWAGRLFASHPPIEKRVARLQAHLA